MAVAEVTVIDVRVALNNMPPAEVSDETIQQKVDDAISVVTTWGYSSTSAAAKRYIRAWAAWRSFIVSKTYSSVRQADLAVKSEWKRKEERLKEDVDDAQKDLEGSEAIIAEREPMFDDRPDDPYDGGSPEGELIE